MTNFLPNAVLTAAELNSAFAPVATGSTTARDLSTRFADVVNVKDYGAKGDGQTAILNVSVAVGSATMTVSLPSAWVANHAYIIGAVVTNNSRAYTCVIAGTSAASGGPIADTGNGAPITDGTAGWFYIGQANISANVFSAADIGKVLSVTRQDVGPGFNPWWNSASTYAGHVFITGVSSPTSITVSATGGGDPNTPGVFPTQSWPYASVPSLICWGTDNSTAFQAALDAVRNAVAASVVYIPTGTYCFSRQMVVYSNTVLRGDGDKSVILPCGVHDTAPQSNIVAVFCNLAYTTQSLLDLPPNSAVSLRALHGDRNITFSDFAIDMRANSQASGNVTGRFFYVDHFRASRVNIFGNPLQGYEALNFISCNDFEVSDSVLTNVGGGFGPWGGSTSGAFRRNRCIVSYNPGQNVVYGAGQPNAVEINVVGTSPSEQEVSDSFWVEDNTIYLNGSVGAWGSPQGLMFFPDGVDSIGLNIFFRRNQIICTGLYNRPILSSGGMKNLVVDGNTIIGADGLFEAPIIIGGQAGNTNSALPSSVTFVAGSPYVTVNWTAHGYTGFNISVVPVFFYTTANVTVNGVVLSNYLPLTSVPNADSIVFKAYTNAIASETVTWTWGAFAQIVVGAIACQVSNNRLIDCAAPGSYLIYVGGIDHSVHHNEAFLSSGAAVGDYLSIIGFTGINGQRGGSAIANTGVPGTGIGLGAGTARVTWNQYEPAPLIIDSDDIDGAVGLTGWPINVKTYGAKGDGTTDDAPAFQAALAAVVAGGHLIVPAGTYAIGAGLSQAITGAVTFQGVGSGVTMLNFATGVEGIAFSLSPAANVHVRGLSIIHPVGTIYTHTGLSITTPLAHSARQGLVSVADVVLTGAWQTAVNIFNCDYVSLDHVYVTGANADASGAGVAIAYAGLASTTYAVELRLSDCSTIGCSVGVQIGDWVQGVYVTNSSFIGNDYGIRWSGVADHADLWLAVSNTHFNSGTRGLFADIAMSPHISNTYTLHFGIPSLDGTWAAFEFHNQGPALMMNNSIYCAGSASPSSVEYGILVLGGNNTTIVGNFISNAKNAGIYFDSTVNTLVTGNIAELPAEIPLVQYAAVDPSNQQYGNQLNGVPDYTFTTVAITGALGVTGSSALHTVGFNGTAPIAKPTVTGAKLPSDTVMASLLTALAAYGLITDSTT